MPEEKINAEVVAVYPNKVTIKVDDLKEFSVAEQALRIGSFVEICDNENAKLLAIIENFSIEVSDKGERKYVLEANPLGTLKDEKFQRGGDELAIPPKEVSPARIDDIKKIYLTDIEDKNKFTFSKLSRLNDIEVYVNGNKFFDKHIAIIGSTGSGKSHTITKIIQTAINSKNGSYDGLNNSHIVLFDIHAEYKSAFESSNNLGIEELVLPYWLLNSEELEEILLDTGDRDNYNQSSIFRTLVTENKRLHNPDIEKIFYDSPIFFDIHEVKNALMNYRNETVNYKNPNRYMIEDSSYTITDGKTDNTSGIELSDEERLKRYFAGELKFHPPKSQNISKGDYADGTLDKFSKRLQAKIEQDRLEFLFGEKTKKITLENAVRQFIGYMDKSESNITVIDLSGIPFEVLSITVSLISRILFEYGYYYKRVRTNAKSDEEINNDVPLLLVYEEAHKYVPKSDLSKYRSSRVSIERIAKEGRKYGVTLLIASQRPSEISETIFSQCNNFIAMRLTNPDDQIYVRRLLPDSLGNLTDGLPSLKAGEALLIGDSVVMPSLVQINRCSPEPSSNDIPYIELWKERWKDLPFVELIMNWQGAKLGGGNVASKNRLKDTKTTGKKMDKAGKD